jgi:methionyl-tRNA synthetase
MNTATQPLYVTTAIPFVNARPHLGFALELCIADVLARHGRSRGKPVHFVTGSDDHSLKNVLAAERAGISTATFVREHAAYFRQLCATLGVSHDAFVSTSQHRDHETTVHALWRQCSARGDLYQQRYSGLYCVGCERFCDPGETRCAEHSAPLEQLAELNWFFRLSRYAAPLRGAIESDQLRITPTSAREETLALLREPLPDLCVSRSASRARGWGIPVPDDAEQVIWVWFDALAYYLTALGFGADDKALFERYWSERARQVQVIGKGVTRFHALIWPALLRSAGLSWPSDLLVHGYLTQGGEKISKSGSTLDPQPLLADFGSDAVRYYLLRHVRTTRDGDFTLERFIQAYNAELANGLGNLVNRTLGLVRRVSGGAIPPAGAEEPVALELRHSAAALPASIDRAVERFALDEALNAVFSVIDAGNRFVDKTAPWALIQRGEAARAGALLRTLLETLRVVAAELAPFLPQTSARLGSALGDDGLCQNGTGVLRDGYVLPQSLQLFPRREPHLAPQ